MSPRANLYPKELSRLCNFFSLTYEVSRDCQFEDFVEKEAMSGENGLELLDGEGAGFSNGDGSMNRY